ISNILFIVLQRTPRTTLFPYTTLFRSQPTELSEADLALVKQGVGDKSSKPAPSAAEQGDMTGEAPVGEQRGSVVTYFEAKGFGRSEEHTSELQSRGHLVCRLLLEKKRL